MSGELRGRQHEARRNDQAVLEAARLIFARDGFEAPMAAIAKEAGVGVGSLYRRYESKQQLLQELCLAAMEENLAAAQRALEHDDPWDGLVTYIHDSVASRSGALAPLAGRVKMTDELAATASRALRSTQSLVRRAQGCGALRSDITYTDVLILIETISRGAPAKPLQRARLVAMASQGLRSQPAGSLPGRALSTAQYRRRWERPSESAADVA
jgi:AcrR family transcriptional regulator